MVVEVLEKNRVQNKTTANVSSQIGTIKRTYSRQIIPQINSFYQENIIETVEERKKLNQEITKLVNNYEGLTAREEMRNAGNANRKNREKEILEDKISQFRKESNEHLDSISSKISNNLSSKRRIERFLGNLSLIHSNDNSSNSLNNSYLKPIYTSSLAITLLKDLIDTGYQFQDKVINSTVSELKKAKNKEEESENFELLSKTLFEPIIKSIFIYHASLKSENSKEILGDDKEVSSKVRSQYLRSSKKTSLEYLIYGVNASHPEFENKEELIKWSKAKKEELLFMKEFISSINTKKSEISQILQICQQYTSFILPDKEYEIHDLNVHAYQVLQNRANDGKINHLFTNRLLKIMGKFPIGTGIHYYDTQCPSKSKCLEKGIVTRIYPESHNKPVIKQLSSKGILVKDISNIKKENFVVKKENNLFYSINSFPFEITRNYIVQNQGKDKKFPLTWNPDNSIAHTIDIGQIW